MTFPSVPADADPDPTTQITWPTARPRRGRRAPLDNLPRFEIGQRDGGGTGDIHTSGANGKNGKTGVEPGRRHLSTWNLVTLSISMAGAQVAWTVELGCARLQVFSICAEVELR
jgi:solute carrier family 45 protein 1/2/4